MFKSFKTDIKWRDIESHVHFESDRIDWLAVIAIAGEMLLIVSLGFWFMVKLIK